MIPEDEQPSPPSSERESPTSVVKWPAIQTPGDLDPYVSPPLTKARRLRVRALLCNSSACGGKEKQKRKETASPLNSLQRPKHKGGLCLRRRAAGKRSGRGNGLFAEVAKIFLIGVRRATIINPRCFSCAVTALRDVPRERTAAFLVGTPLSGSPLANKGPREPGSVTFSTAACLPLREVSFNSGTSFRPLFLPPSPRCPFHCRRRVGSAREIRVLMQWIRWGSFNPCALLWRVTLTATLGVFFMLLFCSCPATLTRFLCQRKRASLRLSISPK